jgi:hypothetical protein
LIRHCYTARPVHGGLETGDEEKEKEVDEQSETLHNLTSLLLTNKTIRKAQQGSTRFGSLKINSR